jgi:hypothetical protein
MMQRNNDWQGAVNGTKEPCGSSFWWNYSVAEWIHLSPIRMKLVAN